MAGAEPAPELRPRRGTAARPARQKRALAAAKGLATLAALVGVAVWLHGWRQALYAGDFATIRTDMAALRAGAGWVDPRWSDEAAALVAELEPIRADERDAIEELSERLRELSFVASIGAAEVIWPDGLQVELRMREPVACVHVGRHYLGLAADGTLLSGRWPAPPSRDNGFLPVLSLAPDGERDPRRALVPGERLDEPAALDGLAVAVSLWRHLAPADLRRLGRCRIDARRARLASVEDPGTVIFLEGRRSVWFGRSPNLGEPGELPEGSKWEQLARALALLEPDPARSAEPDGIDWDLVDVRWDEADLHPRGSETAESSGG